MRPLAEVHLLPRPRKIRYLPGGFRLSGRRDALRAGSSSLIFREAADYPDPQRYSLRIGPDRILIRASSPDGFRYGGLTLRQLVDAASGFIPAMQIDDWPDFPARGVMLDISRDKVPTSSTLRRLIDLLADWKINQLQLYTEHTFAYAGHERVWRGSSPLTGRQVEALDEYCRQRGVELVPNQNSFGHMERWLRHEPYAKLAEARGPWRTPWGEVRRRPTTLNPLDQRCIRLVGSLYDQLLSHFRSGFFNVGCDETWELGQGASAAACRRRGAGRIYLDYLLKLHRLVSRRGRRMMFWADIAFQHPELIAELPPDVIPLIWGYEADHPFGSQCAVLARRRLDFYVCPGTSSWCSFGGRTRNCLANIANAAAAGRRCGAAGFLITDWGDFGHRQYLPASYCGLLYGAAMSWCGATNGDIDVARELSGRVFGDPRGVAGRLWLDAGAVHELSGVSLKNRTVLFSCMEAKLGDKRAACGMTARSIQAMLDRIDELKVTAAAGRWPGDEARLAGEELLATLAVLRHACLRAAVATAPLKEASRRRLLRELAADLNGIISRHRRLWLKRNRPGGLAASMAYYRRHLAEYRAATR